MLILNMSSTSQRKNTHAAYSFFFTSGYSQCFLWNMLTEMGGIYIPLFISDLVLNKKNPI